MRVANATRIERLLGEMGAVVVVAGALGTWMGPEQVSASDSECGWECKGLKCKQDPEYPDIRCEEEVPGVCTNFECEPSPR